MNHALRVVNPGLPEPPETEQPAAPARICAAAAIEEGLAAAALAMEDHRAVIRHCSRIVQLQADHFEAWFNLGYARHRIGEFKEAEFAYRQALRLRPEVAQTYINLAALRQSEGDAAGAREAYENALRTDPGNEAALQNLAVMLEPLCPEEAEQCYARLLELDPRRAEPWFRIGMIRLSREDWEAGLDAFDACLRQRPEWAEAAVNRAIACLRLGRVEEAGEGFQSVLDANPDSPDALRGLAAMAVAGEDWEQVRSLRRRLRELRQPLPELTCNLALAMEREGQLEEAARLYCEALKEQPTFAEALLNLGHVLDRQGRGEEARECWKRAVTLDGDLAGDYFDG